VSLAPDIRSGLRSDVPQIELAGVTKSFGHGPAVLESLDLTVGRGEFVSIIGPSGCGKSTILKLISGLTLPTSGAIRVEDMTPKNARETISYVFQEATLLPWRTVAANIGLSLELEGVAGDLRKEKVASLLSLVGLSHVANAYPRELSGGMKMRVSIARALATSPRLLLLDEPFAALDEMSRDHLNEEILRLRGEQKWAAVFVTHSVSEAAFLSDRIVVLAPNPGRVHAIFPVDLPSPRVAAMRTSPEFDALVARVTRALRETMTA
jgi:NitT/TauT family transport system ATP-binding protein